MDYQAFELDITFYSMWSSLSLSDHVIMPTWDVAS